jgi:hypothetical protein
MTYEDPRSGRERNLGQDDVGSSTGSLIAGIIFVAAIVFGGWYFYNQSQKVADNKPSTQSTPTAAATTSPQNSGPGVQGNAGNKNGPAANSNSSTGSSSGNTGVGADNTNIDKTTSPSQDSTGVKGSEGGKNGPGANAPAPSDKPANNPAPQPSTNP